jgi:hypothetical protein
MRQLVDLRGDTAGLAAGRTIMLVVNGGWITLERLLNRFRGFLIRWDKTAMHYFAGAHLACTYEILRQPTIFG